MDLNAKLLELNSSNDEEKNTSKYIHDYFTYPVNK